MRDIRTTEHPPKGRVALYKLDGHSNIWGLSLPVGVTCPHAVQCKTFVHPGFLHPVGGPKLKYVCLAAQTEINVKANKVIWHNLKTIIESEDVTKMLADSISEVPSGEFVRLHEGGDFHSQSYLQSWMRVMRDRSDLFFEVSTKALPWLLDEHISNKLPTNATIAVSSGGTHDHLIPQLVELAGVKVRHVAHTHAELESRKYPILSDVNALATEDEAAFHVQGLQFEDTPSGKVVTEIGSGNTIPQLVASSHFVGSTN